MHITTSMKNISFDTLKKRAQIVNETLAKLLPNVKCALHYSNPLELLIATILSAQCTDKMVNIVTEKLFEKYKTIDDYVNATQEEFEVDIKSTGFYRAKAKNILNTVKIIKEKFNGVVPNTMDELITLSGVARKTANIVLGNAYGVVVGIAVDTHVRRLSQKFGLTKNDDPVKIEQDLMKIIPQKDWFMFSHRIVEYGRLYSPAQKRNDDTDPISQALLENP